MTSMGCQRGRILGLPGSGGEGGTLPEGLAVADPKAASPALPAIQPDPADWPWWRGPTMDGISRADKPPTQWSATENVAWKTPFPGRGHSSPIIWKDRIFLSTADDAQQVQSILCLDRATGRMRWIREAHRGGFMRIHPKNSHASATCACDGERVFAAFLNLGSLWVTATDLEGNIVWQTDAGPFTSEHGYGSAPVLFESLVIVNGDNLQTGFLSAIHRETGKLVWRVPRPTNGRHGSYASPIVASVAGKPRLLLAGGLRVCSYDPASGQLDWECQGPSLVAACTLAFDRTRVYASGGYPEKEILAIDASGTGDVSGSGVAWRSTKGVTYVPSPLLLNGKLLFLNDQGIVNCFEASTGETLWNGRLRGAFTASPIHAGGYVYATNEAGKTYVCKADGKLEVVAENDLGSGGMATAAFAGNQLFLRTSDHLYRIGEPDALTKAAP